MQMKRLVLVLLTAALVFFANIAGAQDRNLLPKYGSLPILKWQEEADAKFIAAMDEEYHGDRNKASMEMSAWGWKYSGEGNLDDAMRRFNQAWLLNNRNGTALWGMAAIEASAGKSDESLKLFAEAELFSGSEVNFSVDYAKAVGLAALKKKDNALLKDALDRFERAYGKAPDNTKNLQNWAMTLFMKKRYSEAWAKIKLAEATPSKGDIDPRFVAALQSRMPRPQD